MSILILIALAAAPAAKFDPCQGSDTISMAQCMDGKIEQATARLKHYRAIAFNRFHDDKQGQDLATTKALENSAVIADAYRTTYCDAVYQQWIGGTIRYAMHQSCTLRLIDRETHDIWRDFLSYMDSTPPLLPEPKPTP
ncbi:MAG: hypothetical protein ABR588_08460 [Sphingomicrobium sp.]|nr:DUF1311 domain-containing protein [Sphingomonadales bacterium]